MATKQEQSPSPTHVVQVHDMEKEVSLGETSPPSCLECQPARLMPPDSALIEAEFTYPEGGRAAWLVVLGAWCSLTASLGLYNSAGVLEAFVSKDILADESTSTIGWIFGIYAFMTFFCGVQVGPTFDAKGPRELMIAGSICTVVSIFTLSVCRDYYQFILAFSLLGGAGSSLLLTPGMGSISHWFFKRRGLASGIAFTGGGFGGVLFPLMIQSLLPQIGWAWTMRVLGFILLFLCVVSVAFCRGRVLPRGGGGAVTTWRDTLPDPRIFIDGTGAMAVTTVGVALTDMAYLVPMTYVPSYYLERENLPDDPLADRAAFAYQLLAIINSASCVGRFVAGDLADRYGRYNTMIISLFLCVVSVSCLFLPDALVPEISGLALLVVFALVFGFCSGSNVSLTPICLGQLCETQDYGRYYASCYTVVSFCCLTGIPIAGALLDATGLSGKARYWGAITFSGLCYLVAFVCFIWVRVRVKGADWRVKW